MTTTEAVVADFPKEEKEWGEWTTEEVIHPFPHEMHFFRSRTG
jgi:hypothetical protein